MRPTAGAPQPSGDATQRLRWNAVLRALREARGVTQDGWAAQLSVSRKTVQRREAGERVPDPGAEGSVLAYCHERNLFRAHSRGLLAGLDLTPDTLHDLFAEARFEGGTRSAGAGLRLTHPPPVRTTVGRQPLRLSPWS